jgi:hypothetical protein
MADPHRRNRAVAGMLKKNEGALQELYDCFGHLIKSRIASTLGRDCPSLKRAEPISKIADRIDTFLKSNRMAALRKLDSRRGSLQAWISVATSG